MEVDTYAVVSAVTVQATTPFLLDLAIKSVLLLLITGFVVACMRRSSAAARHLVWCVAMVSLLVLPLLSVALPNWQILPNWTNLVESSVVRDAPPAITATGSSVVSPHVNLLESSSFENRSLPLSSEHPISSEQQEFVKRSDPATLDASISTPVKSRWTALRLATIGWIVGVALTLTPPLLGIASLWRLGRTSRQETDPTWLSLLRNLLNYLHCERDVVLLKSDCRRMPMTWGVFTPKVLLPEDSEEWPAERQRVVMLHELAHVVRWDYPINLMRQLACAFYWFNPLVWVASRQMIAERERACDDIVLSHGSKPTDYAQQVLEIASGSRLGRFQQVGAIAMARPMQLEGRLVAILDPTRNRATVTRVVAFWVLALSIFITVPVAMMRAEAADDDSEVQIEPKRAELINDGDHVKKVKLAAAERRLERMTKLQAAGEVTIEEYEDAKDQVELLRAEMVDDVDQVGKIKLAAAERLLERMKTLHKAKAVSSEEYEDAKDQVELLRAEMVDDVDRVGKIKLATAERRLARMETLHKARAVSSEEYEDAKDQVELLRAEMVDDVDANRKRKANVAEQDDSAHKATAALDNSPEQPAAKPLEFAPQVERTVNDDRHGKYLIDFDSGKLFEDPDGVKFETEAAFIEWARSQGIDAMGQVKPSYKGLIGFDMIAIPTDADGWKKRPAGVEEDFNFGDPGTPAIMDARAGLPATFFIQTREGGRGVLQITGIGEDNAAPGSDNVTFRYQLIAAPTKRVVFRPGEPGAESANWSPLFRMTGGGGDYLLIASVPVGGKFPVGLAGTEKTLFSVEMISGTDAALRVKVIMPDGQEQRLSLDRDQPVDVLVGGEKYTLSYATTEVAPDSEGTTNKAHVMVTWRPKQPENDRKEAEQPAQENASANGTNLKKP